MCKDLKEMLQEVNNTREEIHRWTIMYTVYFKMFTQTGYKSFRTVVRLIYRPSVLLYKNL